MNAGIRTVVVPVKDLDRAKATYRRLLGVEPTSDGPYYVGFTIDGQEIGLDPNGHAQGSTGPTCFVHVDDVQASLDGLLASGSSVDRPVRDVGAGRKIATVTDPDGNVIGLLQQG